MVGFSLGPNLPRLVGVDRVRADEIKTFFALDCGGAWAGFQRIRGCRVFHVDFKTGPWFEATGKIESDHLAIVGIEGLESPGRIRIQGTERKTLDFKTLGVQFHLLNWVKAHRSFDPGLAAQLSTLIEGAQLESRMDQAHIQWLRGPVQGGPSRISRGVFGWLEPCISGFRAGRPRCSVSRRRPQALAKWPACTPNEG